MNGNTSFLTVKEHFLFHMGCWGERMVVMIGLPRNRPACHPLGQKLGNVIYPVMAPGMGCPARGLAWGSGSNLGRRFGCTCVCGTASPIWAMQPLWHAQSLPPNLHQSNQIVPPALWRTGVLFGVTRPHICQKVVIGGVMLQSECCRGKAHLLRHIEYIRTPSRYHTYVSTAPLFRQSSAVGLL